MALIKGFGLFLLGLLTAALSRILSDEFAAWNPSITRRLIRIAVGRLPESERERFDEEWRSHVDEIPGSLGKVLCSAGLLFAAPKVGRTLRWKGVLQRRLALVAEGDRALSKATAVVRRFERGMGSFLPEVRDEIRSNLTNIRSATKDYQSLRGQWLTEIKTSAPANNLPLRMIRAWYQRHADAKLLRKVNELSRKSDSLFRELGGKNTGAKRRKRGKR